eukprot:6914068-Prymnesium_polylepis.1
MYARRDEHSACYYDHLACSVELAALEYDKSYSYPGKHGASVPSYLRGALPARAAAHLPQ